MLKFIKDILFQLSNKNNPHMSKKGLEFIKNKNMIGKKVKLKKASTDKPSSGNSYLDSSREFTVVCEYNPGTSHKAYEINHMTGLNAGWVYEHEIIKLSLTREDINKEIKELQSQVDELHKKLVWMNESGAEEFDEDQFKVYKTLQLLEDKGLSTIEKSKIIAELIRG